MEISEELNQLLAAAWTEARVRKHEYLTQEHLLFAAIFFDSGRSIIANSGGDPDRIRSQLEKHFAQHIPRVEDVDPVQSLGFNSVMNRAILHNASAEKEKLEIGDVLVAIFDEKKSHASFFMRQAGITRLSLLDYITHGVYRAAEEAPTETAADGEESGRTEAGAEPQVPSKSREAAENADSYLSQFTTELTAKARAGETEPLIGRDDILERTLQVLCRRFKNNPVHVGEPGVGKTAITEGLAQRIVEGRVPEALRQVKIYALDLGGLLAGTKYRGDFEERMKRVLAALKSRKDAVLFIDEIHTIVGAGAVSGGSLDASNILKPAIASGKLRCIGSTTHEEYRKYFEKDRALTRRFQKIDIPEPTVEETTRILAGLRRKYEEFHHVRYTEGALRAAAELAARYISERFLPDKAIDVIDEAGALARLNDRGNKKSPPTIREIDIENVVAKMARIPRRSITSSEMEKLENLKRELKRQVFGQDAAVEQVVNAIKRSRAGFREAEKPIASFLFVGPTGVGKTELARQLAAVLGVSLLRFDMSEYQEKHTVSRLIGAPPGYVGYDEGGLLTEAVRKSPHAVLLLDEIEKAHADIFSTLLQVMDYATLTDNSGRKADFRNVILIMTSNAGSREIGKTPLGFGERETGGTSLAAALERIFSPEFRNRLDGHIVFNHLNEAIALRIVKKEVDKFSRQLREKKVNLEISEPCLEWLAAKGFSPVFGAREINRLVEEQVKNRFVDEVLFGKLKKGGIARLDVKNDAIVLAVKPS